MAERKSPQAPQKRGRGRPGVADGGVGREGLIAAARRLLQVHPPAAVTNSLIAREAGVDPGLIRYHFRDRQTLLLAVAEDILIDIRKLILPPSADPVEQLASRVRATVDLAQLARPMQRLLIDELAKSKSPEIRERVTAMHAGAVARWGALFNDAEGAPLKQVDPLFIYVAVIGMCEFFAAAQTMIRPLAPPDSTPEELTDRYKAFIVDLVLNGVRRR